jgi:hydroxymethylpyrimidine pyrophosphatase-like HAD family hydrolase
VDAPPVEVGLMRRCVLTDLDRTLTGRDLVPDVRALERIHELRTRGVRVVVVSGRTLEHMMDLGLHKAVDGLVAENGAIVCVPGAETLEVHGQGFRDAARDALGPREASFRWGRVLGSGPRALAEDATARLRAGGVAHAVSFNAEEAMLLPEGVDKASGARRALFHMGLEVEDAWAVGDGENDIPLLRLAPVAAAPANAPQAVRDAATVLVLSEYSQAFLDFTGPLVA